MERYVSKTSKISSRTKNITAAAAKKKVAGVNDISMAYKGSSSLTCVDEVTFMGAHDTNHSETESRHQTKSQTNLRSTIVFRAVESNGLYAQQKGTDDQTVAEDVVFRRIYTAGADRGEPWFHMSLRDGQPVAEEDDGGNLDGSSVE